MKKPSKPQTLKDPQASREAEKYEQPIASRELILEVMAERDVPMRMSELADALGIVNDSDLFSLQKRLRAMQRDGQVVSGRRGALGLPRKMDLVKCKVIGHRDGYGFASPVEEGDDFFLSSRQMFRVFDGDEVLVAESGFDDKGRPSGQIVEVLTRAHTSIVGRYMEEGGIGYLLPHNRRISNHVLIPPKAKSGAKSGQLVSVKITGYPTEVLGAKGEVEEILGDHLDPGLEIDVAIRAHDIPNEWPEEVLSEAGALRDEPSESDKKNRVDLRKLGLVTIDGEDARDFDDAVYCETEGSGFRLWVAIADVSHYVPISSALDEEAFNRGNSVYFPERVVPMFPEVLSNGLCSLKPAVDRLAMVCEMLIDADGKVTDSTFYEAVIHSHARLTYTQVGEVLENGWCDGVPQSDWTACLGCTRSTRCCAKRVQSAGPSTSRRWKPAFSSMKTVRSMPLFRSIETTHTSSSKSACWRPMSPRQTFSRPLSWLDCSESTRDLLPKDWRRCVPFWGS